MRPGAGWPQTLGSPSLREKAAQMVSERIRGGYAAEDDEDYRYWSRLAFDHGIGGFVVYGGAPYETARLLNRLQKRARVPILMSADFEGGAGQQFGNPCRAGELRDLSAFVVGYGEGGFYGNRIVYADSFLRLLKGEIAATGKLPVAGLELSR
jgi:hypothetical protein